MARIRSLHPGFFTDERMVVTSAHARLLLLGLLTEADDNGVFEWKPITMKMRLFPVEAVDIPALLSELEDARAIAKVEIGGRECGAVRNFCKFQRPKKPHIKWIIPAEFRTFVGLTEESSVPEPPSNGDGEEKSPQMERREGEEEREDSEVPSTPTKAEPVENSRPVRNRKNGSFAFECGVIHLKQKDFDQWKKAFSNLSLEAELIGLAAWAALQKNWFVAVSGALAKKQREAVLAGERLKAEAQAQGNPGPKRDSELWDRGL